MAKSILFWNQYYTHSDTHAYTRRHAFVCGKERPERGKKTKERNKHEINKHIRTHAFDFYRSERKKKTKIEINGIQRILDVL